MDLKVPAIIVGILAVVFVSLFLSGYISFSAVSEPPHIIHTQNINTQSGTVTFSDIKHLSKVYKIEVAPQSCVTKGAYGIYETINGQKVPINGLDSCTGTDYYSDVSSCSAYQHYSTGSAILEVNGLSSSTITYASTVDYGSVGFVGQTICPLSDYCCSKMTGPRGEKGPQNSVIKVYEEVECLIDSDCSDNRVCDKNLCGFPVYRNVYINNTVMVYVNQTCQNDPSLCNKISGSTCIEGICVKEIQNTVTVNNTVLEYVYQTCQNNPDQCKDGSSCIDGACLKVVKEISYLPSPTNYLYYLLGVAVLIFAIVVIYFFKG